MLSGTFAKLHETETCAPYTLPGLAVVGVHVPLTALPGPSGTSRIVAWALLMSPASADPLAASGCFSVTDAESENERVPTLAGLPAAKVTPAFSGATPMAIGTVEHELDGSHTCTDTGYA